jgi:hypothetical protein
MAGERDVPEPPDSTVWLALAVVGLIVFFLGVWMPAFSSVPHAYRLYVQGAVAVVGGALFVLGLSFWYDVRHGEKPGPGGPPTRATKVSLGPSFEIYDPRTAQPVGPPPPAEPPAPDPPTP